MKYFATLPIRRDLIQDGGDFYLLAIVDELTLCRGLDLIVKQRKIDELTLQLEKTLAELERLAQ